MSLPTLSGTGRLLTDPRKALTKAGAPMASALVKFQAWRKLDGQWAEGDSVVASTIGFDDVARSLARYAKGDQVAITGTASVGMWRDQPQLKVTLTDVQQAPERERGNRDDRQQHERPAQGHAERPTGRPAPRGTLRRHRAAGTASARAANSSSSTGAAAKPANGWPASAGHDQGNRGGRRDRAGRTAAQHRA